MEGERKGVLPSWRALTEMMDEKSRSRSTLYAKDWMPAMRAPIPMLVKVSAIARNPAGSLELKEYSSHGAIVSRLNCVRTLSMVALWTFSYYFLY